MASVLVVTSKVKAYAKKLGLRTSGEVIDALSKKVEAIVKEASTKALEAKRKTILVDDL